MDNIDKTLYEATGATDELDSLVNFINEHGTDEAGLRVYIGERIDKAQKVLIGAGEELKKEKEALDS